MEVRDYVRTKNGIEKITLLEWYPTINDYKKYMETDRGEYENLVDFTNILKSSPNIIDLIEVGDIIEKTYKTGLIEKIPINKVEDIEDIGIDFKNGFKLSIVTKEQFESIKYEVK